MAQEAADSPKGEDVSKNPTQVDKLPASNRRGKLTNIKGEVTQVDPGAKSIKIKEGNKEYTMSLTEKTIVTAGKIKKTPADIKPGDKLVARVLEENGTVTVRSIRLAQEGKKRKQEPAPGAKSSEGSNEAKGTDPSQVPQNETTGPSKETLEAPK
jgi:Cu/Ag efflux protein CusF